MDSSGLWLEEEAAVAALTFGDLFMACYLAQSSKAIAEKKPLYRMRPKFHSVKCELLNRLRQGSRLNHRHVGCFNEEDYVGQVTRMLKGAVHPLTLGKRALERMLLGINVHLAKAKQEQS